MKVFSVQRSVFKVQGSVFRKI